MTYDFDRLITDWTRRPLCRRYATAVFCKSKYLLAERTKRASQAIWWALGTLKDGGAEILGAWKSVDEMSGPPLDLFGELCERGVLSIRFCIGNIGSADAVFAQTVQHAAVIPSFQELFASSTALAKPRHRFSVQGRLRAIAELDDSAVARSEFSKFQGSKLGERYPEIARRWNEALARCQPFYELHEPLRELVRSADLTAADLSDRVTRVINRHGPFADSASALNFVAAWLDKAERGWGRGQIVAGARDTTGSSPRRGFRSAAGAVGEPMLA